MFSFHKPKIFRSNNGCCICKAKSSSSRFTCSKKYETEFERCFLIKNEIRTGEICNACVLLVKRCKKLPKENTRNWAHVVDARQGHKSTNKSKSPSTSNGTSSPTKSNRSRQPSTSSLADENRLRPERKVCERLLFNSQNIIANENESNNVLSSSLSNDDELKIVQNVSAASEECVCSNCTYNRELDESEKKDSSVQLSNGIRRLKKTLTPKKLCTETISNSSSGNSSDSNEEDEDYMSDDDKATSKITKGKDAKMVTRSGQTTMHSYASIDPASRKTTEQSSSKSKNKRKFTVKHNLRNDSTFLDMNFWKREQVCCGIIFRNKTNDMVLIDSKLFNPCACRKKQQELKSDKSELSCSSEEENRLNESGSKLNEMEVELSVNEQEAVSSSSISSLSDSKDPNNNFLSKTPSQPQSTSTPLKTEKISINLTEIDLGDVNQLQLNESMLNDPINELVIVNSSSGISSDSSDISSITEEEEGEDSNSSSNNNLTISDHDLIAKNMINNRTFGVL